MSLGTLTLVGNLTRDPEIVVFEKGSLAKAGMAINERRLNQETKEYEDGPTTFVELIVRNGLGDNFAATCKKGDRVIAQGLFRIREFDRADGTKGEAKELLANAVGPELRFATAEVTKTPKKEKTGGVGDEADYFA